AAVRLGPNGVYQIVWRDVMLPKRDGVEALRRIRQASRVPVIMLTARGDDVDRIVGLELGADDYVPKPCTPRELVARLRAILRRLQPQPDGGPLSASGLVMWPEKRRVEWHGAPVLENLLCVLARAGGGGGRQRRRGVVAPLRERVGGATALGGAPAGVRHRHGGRHAQARRGRRPARMDGGDGPVAQGTR